MFNDWDKARTPDERGENNHWLFYTQLGNRDPEVINAFVSAFNRKGESGNDNPNVRFRDDLDSPASKDDADITTMNRKYNMEAINKVMGENKASSWPVKQYNWLIDGITSFMAARTAAQRGGDVRMLLRSDKKLDDDKSFFINFESYELTRPESKVGRILLYNADSVESLSNAPKVIWKQGDAPIGKEANFDKGEFFP